MLATEQRILVYGRQGGSPPPSFELLTVSRDGTARYVAANPWPAHPPFDEIGIYEWTLRRESADPLRSLAVAAAHEVDGAGSHDAGMEYVDAWSPDGGVGAEWNPVAAPPPAAAVSEAVGVLIAEGRRHAASVLQATLEPLGSDGVAVTLTARGRRAFPVALPGADGRGGVEVRIRAVAGDDVVHPSAIPALLAGRHPVEFEVQSVGPRLNGTVELAPGRSLRLHVPRIEAPQDAVRIEALVRVDFPLTAPSGEDYVQPGWLVPEAVWLSGAAAAS